MKGEAMAMKWKLLLCASAGAIGLAGAAPAAALAQAAPAGDAQEAPKPAEASDQSVNPSATPPATQDDTPEPGSAEVVVTGLRRSLESAQTIKRTSDGIVDAVVAEDIGKLPDTFASSALQRVAGVGVTRGGGETAGVTVRGLPDLTTTYNGRQIFTAEGRFVAIQDFPAGTVAALEVYKSGTANQIEGGIAGEVNVRGRKPFDFKGFELSGSANGVAWQQSGKLSWNGNLLVSDRWDTGIGEMGLLANVSWVDLNFQDSTREQSLVIATTNGAQGTPAGLRYPDAQALYYGGGHRWRPSANAAFQWRPTPELEIYVDGLFQGFRSRDENRYMFVPIFGDIQLSNVTTRPGAAGQTAIQSAVVTNAVRPDGFYASVNGKTDTYQAGGGAVWTHDRLKISGDIAYTDSTFTLTSVNVDYLFASSPQRAVNFDVPNSDGGPSFNFLNFDVTNPANFLTRGFFQEYLLVSGKDWQSRGDVEYDLSDTGILRRIQVGVRYADRDAARDRGAPYINTRINPATGLPATYEDLRVPLSALPVRIGRANPGFDFGGGFPVRTFVAIPASSIRDNLTELRAYFGAPAGLPAFDPTENFRANEKSYAAYAQVKYGFDLGSVVVDGLLGIRGIKTKTRISGFSRVDPGGGGPITFPAITARSEVTDWLPNASARVGFTDQLQLRLAYTQTRTRPSFFDLRPNTSLGQPVVLPNGDPCLTTPNTPECVERLRRGGSAGNPNLASLTSDNYDASLEWYFSRTGSLTAAVFRRDAAGFLVVQPDRSQPGLRIDRPFNLGDVRLQGAEVNFTSFLDIAGLPEWAKGFGIQANATYIDSKEDTATGSRRFRGVSKWAYNIIALYEKPVFSARLAYNYRSSFVTEYSFQPLDPIEHPIVERGRSQLDASATVTPIPNVTLAFDVVNILGNPLQRYRPYDTGDIYPRQVLYLERTYSLGVRFRF
jgi:iron complex outermembrane recepter protein